MKKVIFSFALMMVGAFAFNSLNAQTTVTAPAVTNETAQPASNAKITFNKETHDYGTIKNGADGSCVFEFTNTGTDPLIISNAKGSCGCTVPEWPKEPIAPGAKGTIKVNYDTKRTGSINKSVTITSNAGNEPTKVIYIKGEVLAPETTQPVQPATPPSTVAPAKGGGK